MPHHTMTISAATSYDKPLADFGEMLAEFLTELRHGILEEMEADGDERLLGSLITTDDGEMQVYVRLAPEPEEQAGREDDAKWEYADCSGLDA